MGHYCDAKMGRTDCRPSTNYFECRSNLSQFYLELWKEINERASLRAKAEALSSLPTPKPDDVAEGTLFDELIVQYATLTARSEDLIVRHVVSEVQSALNTHMRR